jgi:protein-histidine pros-kinase
MSATSSFDDLVQGSNPDAVIVTSVDDRILFWSPGAQAIYGHARADALGLERLAMMVPADHRAEEARLHAHVLEGETSTYESIRSRKDGSLVHVVVSARLVRDDNGRSPFIVLTEKDVTELKVLRDAKLMQVKFGDLLESTPDAILMANTTGRIVLANGQAARLFGYDAGELLGLTIERLLPERFRPGHAKHRSGYFQQPRTRSMGVGLELYGLRKDGTEFAVEISLSPLKTAEGMLVMSAIRDIGERKRIERALQETNDELRRANQAKDRFLASMSHELRTPLNGIIGFAEFHADGKPGPVNTRQKEHLQDILNSGEHLLRLINDILDLVKVQAGKFELNLSTFRLDRVIEEVCSGVQPMATKKNIEMTVQILPGLESITLDAQRFKQILYNLLSNALKFTDDGGTVQVQAVPSGMHMFRLAVSDTGIGIREEDRHRLFTEFEQLESGSTRRYGGTGLGLALTRKITEMQGGSIELESRYGEGSTFSVILPMAYREPAQ